MRPLNLRSRITNDPRRLAGLDGRSPAGRRRIDLIETFVARLGGWDAVRDEQLAWDVRRAAELVALAEAAREEALKGGPVDLGALVRIEGAADRAVRRLGFSQAAGAREQSLGEYLAARAAEGEVVA